MTDQQEYTLVMETIYTQKGSKRSRVVEFYTGISPDIDGRYIDEIFGYNYEQLENIHSYIQWIFPLNKPSYFNKNAPILTNDEIFVFKSNIIIKSNIVKAFRLLLNFYGFCLSEKEGEIKIIKGKNFNDRIKYWMTKGNHDFQRIRRILKFLKLTGMEHYALLFFSELTSLYKNGYKGIIGKYTYDYWNNAVTGDKEIEKSIMKNYWV
jgi:hypothetical protein